MKVLITASIIALGLTAAAQASPLNGTGNLTGNVIMGSGITDGSWTGVNTGGIEVGMRGKLRYPAANVFNYDGDHTYRFDHTPSTPITRSTFNFEWSIDVTGTGNKLSDYDYILSFDTDPGPGFVFASFDPFTISTYFDHSLGSVTTPTSGGIESLNLPDLLTNMGLYEVAQQSSNLGFGFSGTPSANGIYEFQLSVTEKGHPTSILATAGITIVATPIPAALPMLASALGLAGLVARRRRKT